MYLLLKSVSVRISLDLVQFRLKLTMCMTVSVKLCYVLLNWMPNCVFFLLIVVYVTKEIAKKKGFNEEGKLSIEGEDQAMLDIRQMNRDLCFSWH